MTTLWKIIILALLAISANPTLASGLWREGEFRGAVILTITGNVSLPTRAESSSEIDKYFTLNNIEFENAAQFDTAALQALPQSSVTADFPKDGPVYSFEGPSLKEVLNSVGAIGETIKLSSLDGRVVELPLNEAYECEAIVALKRDGIPFAIGDFGPTHIVFPRADRVDLTDMPDDWWLWSVFHMRVE